MRHLITDISISFPLEGEPVIELSSGRRAVGTVHFEAQPANRAVVPPNETEPFTLHFPTTMRDLVIGLLQRGDGIEFDRLTGALTIRTLRTGRA